jgi:hypothetical protein
MVSWLRLGRVYRLCGQSMVEYALALTVFLLLIMGIVDFGRAFFAFNLVANTAREGARYATIPTRTSAEIVSYATGFAPLFGVTVTVLDRGTAGDSSDPAVVQAAYVFTPITPLIGAICCGGGTLTLSARSSMYVEI